MDKQTAIELLGGTVGQAAKAVNVSPSAVSHWPDPLPDRIKDRVVAALERLKGSKRKAPRTTKTGG